MYLKEMIITNFRKFGQNNNKIKFTEGYECKSTESDCNKDNEINIAPRTTVIVGKNNSGKTTIINALDLLINNGGIFKSNDFNLSYLCNVIKTYDKNNEESISKNLPYMQFAIEIGLNSNSSTDILSKLYQVLSIENVKNDE